MPRAAVRRAPRCVSVRPTCRDWSRQVATGRKVPHGFLERKRQVATRRLSLRVVGNNSLMFLGDVSRHVAACRVWSLTQRIEIVELGDAMKDRTAKRKPLLAFGGRDLLASDVPLAA